MANFPAYVRLPGSNSFTESPDKNAVQVARTADGHPVLNELFTDSCDTWKTTRNLVSQAHKDAIKAHYKAHRGIPFNWTNEQDDTVYEVVYACPPQYQLDRLKNLWKITIEFLEY